MDVLNLQILRCPVIPGYFHDLVFSWSEDLFGYRHHHLNWRIKNKKNIKLWLDEELSEYKETIWYSRLRESAQGKAHMEGDSSLAGVQTSLQHVYYSH